MQIDPKDIIDGLGKGLRVIEAFDEDHPRLTPTEAAQRTGLTRTAARRYLLSLVHFGYASTDGKQFWLAPRVLRLGRSYLEAARLPRLVQPFVQRLSMQCNENFNFSVLDGHEIVYLARSQSNRMVSIGFPVGARVAAHSVTPGLVILSTWTEAALQRWVGEHDFYAISPRTNTDARVFVDQVRETRQLGYWIAEQQLSLGVRGLAVPVKDRKGECVGALGSTVPMQPQSRADLLGRLLPALQDTAEMLRQLI